jgi:hypothetical protein
MIQTVIFCLTHLQKCYDAYIHESNINLSLHLNQFKDLSYHFSMMLFDKIDQNGSRFSLMKNVSIIAEFETIKERKWKGVFHLYTLIFGYG